MAFKAAICPSCGGELQVPDNRDSVKCMYCGTDIIVREAIQTVSGVNIQNYLQLAATAIGAKNYKEAYIYYSKVLEVDINNSEAWFWRATAAAWQATIADPRFSEIQAGFENAIRNETDDYKPILQKHTAATIDKFGTAYFILIFEHVSKYGSSNDTWTTYLSHSADLISLLGYGVNLDPSNQQIMDLIVEICKTNLGGISFATESGDDVRRLSYADKEAYEKIMDIYTAKLQQLDPNYKPPAVKRQWSASDLMGVCCGMIALLIFVVYMMTK
jgi:tetratricopeptide (TPR) repeat protein